tara:strand:- start:91 stop:429 length:339 start_codon:yes stop_codon:yes gene_type:complete
MAEYEDYGSNDKKIMFYDTDKRHADLKVRLQHDGFTQSAFFRMLISGYLEKDVDLLCFIDRYKQENSVQSGKQRKQVNKMIEKGRESEEEHGLKQSEVESIFDLLEQEHPEL